MYLQLCLIAMFCLTLYTEAKPSAESHKELWGKIETQDFYGVENNHRPEPTPDLDVEFGGSLENTIFERVACTDHEFECVFENQCVSNSKICDRKRDCQDGSDESLGHDYYYDENNHRPEPTPDLDAGLSGLLENTNFEPSEQNNSTWFRQPEPTVELGSSYSGSGDAAPTDSSDDNEDDYRPETTPNHDISSFDEFLKSHERIDNYRHEIDHLLFPNLNMMNKYDGHQTFGSDDDDDPSEISANPDIRYYGCLKDETTDRTKYYDNEYLYRPKANPNMEISSRFPNIKPTARSYHYEDNNRPDQTLNIDISSGGNLQHEHTDRELKQPVQVIISPPWIKGNGHLLINCTFNMSKIPDSVSLNSMTLSRLVRQKRLVVVGTNEHCKNYREIEMNTDAALERDSHFMSAKILNPVHEDAGVYICDVQATLSSGEAQTYSADAAVYKIF